MSKNEEKGQSPAENFYDILQNSEGELLFCVQTREGEPDNPEISYSEGDHALFRRRPGQSIILDYIHPEMRETLLKAKEALVAEFHPNDQKNPEKDESVVREYMVKVSHDGPPVEYE